MEATVGCAWGIMLFYMEHQQAQNQTALLNTMLSHFGMPKSHGKAAII